MTTNLSLKGHRGGNRHPIAVKQFIVDRLRIVGEDYIAGLHQAYKEALDQLARDRHRTFLYNHTTYASFYRKIWDMMEEGVLEYSGREIPSDHPNFKTYAKKPMRKYVRLAR